MTLRRLFTSTSALLASLTALAALGLVLVTTQMHDATRALTASLESVRLLDRIEVGLRLHGQIVELVSGSSNRDRAPLGPVEVELRRGLRRAETYVDNAEERALLERVRARVEAYLRRAHAALDDGARAPDAALVAAANAPREESLDGLRQLVELNVAQAHDVRAGVKRWDQRADAFGAIIITLMLAGVTVVLLLVRSNVYSPLVGLRESIAEYGGGARWARAPERGPAELREIARAFNDMAIALERQRESQLAFIAGVVHDLRNPLSALGAAAGLFAPGRPLPAESSVRKAMALVGRQVHRLNQMLGDLLDRTHIEAGHLALRLDTRDARDFVRDVVELYSATSTAHELVAEPGAAPLPVECDPVRIEQVLNNLVSNAIKYSPNGGRIEVRAGTRGEEWAVLSVRDCGVGIAPEDQPHVFEPFHRSTAAREAAPGVGLGLAVSRRIVEAHAGRIELESAPGEGSTFRVLLPLARAAAGERVAEGAAAPADDRGRDATQPLARAPEPA